MWVLMWSRSIDPLRGEFAWNVSLIDTHRPSSKNLAESQGWAHWVHGILLNHPCYPGNKSGRKMDASVLVSSVIDSILVDWGGWCRVHAEEWGVTLGLGCPQLLYVCLISQSINRAWLSGEPSAPAIHQGLSPSHHNREMRPQHLNSISPSYNARQPSQPASTLSRTQRDNKMTNQKQTPLLTSLEICCSINTTLFSPKIEFCFCFFPSSLQKGLKL